MPPEPRFPSFARSPFLLSLTVAAVVLLWQWLTVRYNYQGNWTALYCTGEKLPPPPALAAEGIYLFPASFGFDGQFYHYIAHDPFFARGLEAAVDSPRMRYGRILNPLAAWITALGQDRFVDAAYIGWNLTFVFVGIWWTCRFAVRHGAAAWWGLAFLVLPATLVSIDRLTADVSLCALCVAIVLYDEMDREFALVAALAAACLSRETGFVAAAGFFLACALRREWRRLGLCLLATIPAIAWYAFVALHTPPSKSELMDVFPLAGPLVRLFHPVTYPFDPVVNQTAMLLDAVSILGFLLALGFAAWFVLQRRFTALGLIVIGYAALFGALKLPEMWTDAYSYGRVVSPLLLLLAMEGIRTKSHILVLPLLMVTVRVVLQLAPQAWGIARGIFAG